MNVGLGWEVSYLCCRTSPISYTCLLLAPEPALAGEVPEVRLGAQVLAESVCSAFSLRYGSGATTSTFPRLTSYWLQRYSSDSFLIDKRLYDELSESLAQS